MKNILNVASISTEHISRVLHSEVERTVNLLRNALLIYRAPILSRHPHAELRELAADASLTNPSIAATQSGKYIAARVATYRLSRVRQRNVDIDNSRPATVLIQPEGTSERLRPVILNCLQEVTELEDPRLFEWRQGLWALWTQALKIAPGKYQNSMVIGEIVDGQVHALHALPSPRGRTREKNWMVIADGDSLRFITELETLDTYEYREHELKPVSSTLERVDDLTGHSGSSTFVPFGSGWIGVSHRHIVRPRSMPWLPVKYYWHYIVRLNRDLSLLDVSRPFIFHARGVEFCAGLIIDGSDLVFSFGIDDVRAALLRIDLKSAEALLFTRSTRARGAATESTKRAPA